MNSRSIAEADWKVFRELKTVALERYCQQVLSDVASLSAGSGQSAHERCLALYDLVKHRDQKLALIFDGMSRSRASQQLTLIMRNDLLTEEEMARFSPELREEVERFLSIGRS